LAYLTAEMRVAAWCQGAAKNCGALTYPLSRCRHGDSK